MASISAKILLTPVEAASILGISENTIRKLCETDPTFPSFLNGSHHKISRSGLEKWIEQQCLKSQDNRRT